MDAVKLAMLDRLHLTFAVEHKLSAAKLKAEMKERGHKGKALDHAIEATMAFLAENGMTKTRTRSVYALRKTRPEPVEAGATEEE